MVALATSITPLEFYVSQMSRPRILLIKFQPERATDSN